MTGMSKARSLEKLSGALNRFHIPINRWFSVNLWRAESERIVSEVCKEFVRSNTATGSDFLAIRSSASDEDGAKHAKAGEYDSVLNVPSNDPKAIREAVESVIESYSRKGAGLGEDEVIIQEMVQNTIMSGVVFTHDLNSGAPYYVINYDDVSGYTNTVTAGDGEYSNRTIYIHRGAIDSLRSERFQKLLQAIVELEEVMGSQFLDIEFAIGQDLTPFLLQVRSITTRPNWNRAVARRIDAALIGIQEFVKKRLQPLTGVYGATTVLGQMPDWNPAELIGRAPRGLAYSLYGTLITDNAWRLAREQMGYAVPKGQPLMLSLAGQPFIDTRLSFHSYLPGKLAPEIANKLVNAWVHSLKENPHLHDKIEFDVAITTYSFDIDDKIKNQTGGVLSAQEIEEFKAAVKEQSISLISGNHTGSIANALANIEELRLRQLDNGLAHENDFNAIFSLVEDCIKFGTIPFSILARHGFIARTILLSLVKKGIFTLADVHGIQSGIRTVASDLVDDMRRMQSGHMSRDEFMKIYGHLRPGTYDILSLRYDQMPDLGKSSAEVRAANQASPYTISDIQKKKINELLAEEGYEGVDVEKLLDYFKEAIAGREYGKFIFTKNVSSLLESIANFGESHGLSRDELSYIPFNELLKTLRSSAEGTIEDRLRTITESEIEKHAVTSAIRLPQVLFDEAGVHVVPFQVSQPNFITNKKVTGDCVRLTSEQSVMDLTGKIVLIENADPGFDWIFSQPIGGLITKYGGANSHMAIRCAEFGIPAAIGCGEQRFEILTEVDKVMLDCSTSLIQHLN